MEKVVFFREEVVVFLGQGSAVKCWFVWVSEVVDDTGKYKK